MIAINYEAINRILDDLMKANKIKNKSQLLVKLSVKMDISFQRCWSLIQKQNINNIKQLNLLAEALGVDVMEIITIRPKTDALPITQIF